MIHYQQKKVRILKSIFVCSAVCLQFMNFSAKALKLMHQFHEKSDFKKLKQTPTEHKMKKRQIEEFSDSIEETINFSILLIIILGILLLPSVIAAVLDLDSIRSAISDLSDLLTKYYVDLNQSLASITSTLATILSRVNSIRTTVNSNAAQLTTIIALINAAHPPFRSTPIELNDVFSEEHKGKKETFPVKNEF